MDVDQEDFDFWKRPNLTEQQLVEHVANISSEAKRHAEVTIKNLTPEEKELLKKAMWKELDQWVSNAVFKIAQRSGVPKERVMTMRWVLTWKVNEETVAKTAKARLVVKGFTDPDLTTLRPESPTLSRLGKHWLLQLAASLNWIIRKGM